MYLNLARLDKIIGVYAARLNKALNVDPEDQNQEVIHELTETLAVHRAMRNDMLRVNETAALGKSTSFLIHEILDAYIRAGYKSDTLRGTVDYLYQKYATEVQDTDN